MHHGGTPAPKDEILVGFAGGTNQPLGNIWKITAKKTDFYINPLDAADALHLSAHGPNERDAEGHRFHVKLGERARREVRREHAGRTTDGYFLAHDIPRKGQQLDGRLIAPNAWLVARIRWTWDMQRPRYRAAAYRGGWPTVGPDQSAFMMREALSDNEAADVDIVVSYDKPFWPHEQGARRDNAQLGPLRNASGMWLTATTYRRSQMKYPAPDQLIAGRPLAGETPNRIMGGGLGEAESAGVYWLVESITSREIIDHNIEAGGIREGFIGRSSA